MTTRIYFCLIILFVATGHAGGVHIGNGCSAVVCKGEQGFLKKPSVFDLFEGFALNGYGYQELEAPADKQAQQMIPQVDKMLGTFRSKSLLNPLNSIIERMKFLPEGVGLEPTEDLANFITPKGCQISQLINYRDDGEVYADSEIWKDLSPTHQAAAYIHEVIYEYARMNGEELTSFRIRKAVSLIFSGQPLEPVVPVNLNKQSQWQNCVAGKNQFVIVKRSGNLADVYFTRINNRVALSTSSLKVPFAIFNSTNAPTEELLFKGRIASKTEFGPVVEVWSAGQTMTMKVSDVLKQFVEPITCQTITKNQENL